MSETITAQEYQTLAAKEKRHKYNAQRCEVEGIWFDSKLEARRYEDLRMLERGGAIQGLELQPRFPIVLNDVKICDYVADFTYQDCETGQQVVEDCKSPATRTSTYRLKAKLVKAIYGFVIVEVSA